MSRTRWSLVVLWLVACGAPENRNPSRCDPDGTCTAALMCYRGYCIADDEPLDVSGGGEESSVSPSSGENDAGAGDDAASSQGDTLSGAANDAGAAATQDSSAPSAPAADDASASAPPATEPPPAAAPSQPTTPAEPPAMAPPAATPPATTPVTPPAATPPAVTPPEVTPPATPPATPPSTPGSDGSAVLIGLIGAGLAPVSMLACVPDCVLGFGQRECQRCLQKVLKQDYGSEACVAPDDDDDDEDDDDDDDKKRSRAPKDACALLTCTGKSCGDDT